MNARAAVTNDAVTALSERTNLLPPGQPTAGVMSAIDPSAQEMSARSSDSAQQGMLEPASAMAPSGSEVRDGQMHCASIADTTTLYYAVI